MEEQLISFETAKLAKEKGFTTNKDTTISIQWLNDCDAQTKESYEPECFLNGDNYKGYKYSKKEFKELFKGEYYVDLYIPTLSLLQKWLREEHNIHVFCSLDRINKKGSYWVEIGVKNPPEFELDYLCVYETDLNQGVSYEDSLEQGLKEALTLISTP